MYLSEILELKNNQINILRRKHMNKYVKIALYTAIQMVVVLTTSIIVGAFGLYSTMLIIIIAGAAGSFIISRKAVENQYGLWTQIKLSQRLISSIGLGILVSTVAYGFGYIFSQTFGLILALLGGIFAVIGIYQEQQTDKSSMEVIKDSNIYKKLDKDGQINFELKAQERLDMLNFYLSEKSLLDSDQKNKVVAALDSHDKDRLHKFNDIFDRVRSVMNDIANIEQGAKNYYKDKNFKSDYNFEDVQSISEEFRDNAIYEAKTFVLYTLLIKDFDSIIDTYQEIINKHGDLWIVLAEEKNQAFDMAHMELVNAIHISDKEKVNKIITSYEKLAKRELKAREIREQREKEDSKKEKGELKRSEMTTEQIWQRLPKSERMVFLILMANKYVYQMDGVFSEEEKERFDEQIDIETEDMNYTHEETHNIVKYLESIVEGNASDDFNPRQMAYRSIATIVGYMEDNIGFSLEINETIYDSILRAMWFDNAFSEETKVYAIKIGTDLLSIPKTKVLAKILIYTMIFEKVQKKEIDPYEILEISKDATEREIKKAYRALAKKYHPDKVDSNDEEKVKEHTEKMALINKAKDMLLNKK